MIHVLQVHTGCTDGDSSSIKNDGSLLQGTIFRLHDEKYEYNFKRKPEYVHELLKVVGGDQMFSYLHNISSRSCLTQLGSRICADIAYMQMRRDLSRTK